MTLINYQYLPIYKNHQTQRKHPKDKSIKSAVFFHPFLFPLFGRIVCTGPPLADADVDDGDGDSASPCIDGWRNSTDMNDQMSQPTCRVETKQLGITFCDLSLWSLSSQVPFSALSRRHAPAHRSSNTSPSPVQNLQHCLMAFLQHHTRRVY